MNRFSRLSPVLLSALFAVACEPKGDAGASTDADKAKTDVATPATKAGEMPAAPADVAAPPSDATKTASGLSSKVLKPGTGEKPTAADRVQVHYTGWTTDGKAFDSSVKRGEPTSFKVTQVIPGWTEGLQLMSVGETRRLWIPEELAYKGRAGQPAGMLVFDVELLDIIKPPATPEDVAAAPADAQKTPSGLASKVLTPGKGGDKPRAHDKVTVHYSGWTTDGKMFDSSVERGTPATFGLNQVIPGWTEGVPLMEPGEKRRFWIPEELAYKGRRGPQGMLVFDIELIEVERMPDPPKTPDDVAKAPSSAKKTKTGLAYRVLNKGTGTAKSTKADRVKVNYSGWTTDGKMFDSSVTRGTPATFGVGQVIPGWTEGLQLMVVGETTRFWIPEDLAYKGKQGPPQGMLVFDVELLEIVPPPPPRPKLAPKPPTAPKPEPAKK